MEEKNMAATTTAAATNDNAKVQNNSLFIGIQPTKKLHKEHTLPTWGLPQRWQEIIEEVAFCKNAPRDYCVAAMIGTAASILRKRVRLTYNEFQNYPCLWEIFVGNSSRGKSPVLSWFWKPLQDWSSTVNSEYDKAVAEWKKQGQQGTRPMPKDFIINDMTAEARNYALKRNGEQGAVVLADELGSFFGCFARYNNGTTAKEISDLNSVFISSSIKIDRADIDKRLTINEPFLNIMGGVQDDRLAKYFGNELMMDSGFVQRCMFVFPDESPRSRNKAKISDEAIRDWRLGIENLLAMDIPTIELELDDQAAAVFDEYSDMLTDKEESAENSYLVSLYSKHRYFVLRWAEVVAFVNERDMVGGKVTGDDMRYSIECMEYFEHCALKVYDLIRKPEKKMSRADAIRVIAGEDGKGIINQTQFAESIGTTQQNISKILKRK